MTTRRAVARALNGPRHTRVGRGLLRAGILAACVAGAIVFYPRAEPVVVERWWPKVVRLTDEIGPMLREVGAEIRSRLPEPDQTGERRTVIAVPVANVRAGPSPGSPVIVSLSRDAEVTPVERRGTWVLIRIGGAGGKHGWVHHSLLGRSADPK